MSFRPDVDTPTVAVIGAGPAGLTAAYQLVKSGRSSVVLEADDVVGGISRTVEREGWRFDIGGHRFFTKVSEVQEFWEEILTPDDFLVRERMSRIFYEGKYYEYPIRPLNALRNLGPVEALRCVGSFTRSRVRPPKSIDTLEQYIVANYGRRLFEHFFETYNEKVWGVPASQLSADWGAQRIKGMSLAQAVWEPMRSRLTGRRRSTADQVTSLIEEFRYPKHGPGMMWEQCRDRLAEQGIPVLTGSPVSAIRRDGSGATELRYGPNGTSRWLPVDHVISSMPLSHLVQMLDPVAPPGVMEAARSLRYRDFLTVAVVVPEHRGFPDNWIYVHDPAVRVGRIQNFGSWSPYMVKQGRTCLGLEYFLFEGSDLWCASDDDLVGLAATELEMIGLVEKSDVERGYVVRVPRAYPVYDPHYAEAVDVIRDWLADAMPNVHPVGRNGMHKYNNQDHSMLTAMLAVENIVDGAGHDVWSVNVDADYHEESRGSASCGGTGRSAPIVPQLEPLTA